MSVTRGNTLVGAVLAVRINVAMLPILGKDEDYPVRCEVGLANRYLQTGSRWLARLQVLAFGPHKMKYTAGKKWREHVPVICSLVL